MKNAKRDSMSGIWRMNAMMLLVFFTAFLFAPFVVLAEDTNSSLAACCRAHGKHHCSMKMEVLSAAVQGGNEPTFSTPFEKCPYTPSSPTAPHNDTFQPSLRELISAETFVHSAEHPRTESKQRIIFDRSRQKRGPPTRFLSA